MNVSGSAPWIFMFFLVLLVFGAIAAIIWRSWIVGTIVLVLVLLIGGFVFTYRAVGVASPSMIFEHQGPTSAQELDPETLKTADVFPSFYDAASALARRIPEDVRRNAPTVAVETIHIVTTDKQEFAHVIREVLQQEYPGAKIVLNNIAAGEDKELRIEVKVDGPRENQRLLLIASLARINLPQASAGVVDAPWVRDLGQYAADNPRGEWIAGWSADLVVNREAALKLAREDAARQMVAYARAKFVELNQADPQTLRIQLEQQLALRRFPQKEFVQRLRLLNAGEVYRAGILVDASPAQLEQLRGTVVRQAQRSHSSVRRMGGGLVGMGVLICLLYLFLNRATRGYFQMNLRLAATMALVAGVLLILLITGLRLA